MYRTLLVPLDGSRRAEAILPHVEALAQQFGATVVLLQVVEPAPTVMTPHGALPMLEDAELVERDIEAADHYLAAWQGELREKGITARRRIERGPVVPTIIGVAEAEQADLVAMASHGHTGLARVFYGSVAAGVLHRVDRPLLIVRA